jgi:hypothetical protein
MDDIAYTYSGRYADVIEEQIATHKPPNFTIKVVADYKLEVNGELYEFIDFHCRSKESGKEAIVRVKYGGEHLSVDDFEERILEWLEAAVKYDDYDKRAESFGGTLLYTQHLNKIDE